MTKEEIRTMFLVRQVANEWFFGAELDSTTTRDVAERPTAIDREGGLDAGAVPARSTGENDA